MLASLSLARNHLPQLPASIQVLSVLRVLDVSANFITVLPDTIVGSLRCLETLLARDNRLAAAPSALWKLPALREVDLSGNAITTLSADASQAPALVRLAVARNPLTAVAPELLSRIGLDLDLSDTPVYLQHSSAVASVAHPLSPAPLAHTASLSAVSAAAAAAGGSLAPASPPPSVFLRSTLSRQSFASAGSRSSSLRATQRVASDCAVAGGAPTPRSPSASPQLQAAGRTRAAPVWPLRP